MMLSSFTEIIIVWQSKQLSKEKIRPSTTANNNIYPKMNLHNSKMRVEFKGSCLKQDKETFTPRNVVNSFIVYKLDRW